MKNKAVHVYYSGRVQGVGFRFRTEAIATERKVSGWVKNLFDGRVELKAEASEAVLNDFLATIDAQLGYSISAKDVFRVESIGDCSGFKIRY